ncbi:hypothetical protein BJX66DRAFT_339067 [Aspergillus keveii]|uniref:H-type lectin domain-containing protein n=1 Tax=Aspergillus keveii TaxID=714993 RepID=A0ABR4G2C9_9EURO
MTAVKTPKICLAGIKKDEDLSESKLNEMIAQSVQINPRNQVIGHPVTTKSNDGRAPRLAMMTGNLWKPGSVLNVSFRDGTQWQKNQVKKYAPLWIEHANLKFKFFDTYDKSVTIHILITFDPKGGSWSLSGTESASAIWWLGQTSMNLDNINPDSSEVDMRQRILHEFGHALGAAHEHQSPRCTIPWNKEAIYAAFKGTNMTKKEIDNNILNPKTMNEAQATRFDPDSIMLYYYPPQYTLDGKGTNYNVELSATDKAYMRFCYPPQATEVGYFDTMEVSPDKARSQYKAEKSYHEDINPSREAFTAQIATWEDSILNSAGMTWLAAGPKFDFLQMGVVDLGDIFRWGYNKARNWTWVSFPDKFSTQPKVVCFIRTLDLDNKANWRFKTYASNVSTKGFYMNINSEGDTIMQGAKVSWVAYPEDRPGITSGHFSTADVQSSEDPQAQNNATQKFDKQFADMPQVLVALDEIDFDCKEGLRVRVGTSMVTETGFDWNLETWEDSIMYGAGASYIAWGEPARKSEGLTFV